MEIRECSRCKKEIPMLFYRKLYTVEEKAIKGTKLSYSFETYDLCSECYDKIKSYLDSDNK